MKSLIEVEAAIQKLSAIEVRPDWSINHDHYLYGTAKRYPDNSQ